MTTASRVILTNDVDLSSVAYGMWRLGDDTDTSPSHIQAKIEACLALGITTMDQADIYGGYEAEELLGACFRQSPALRDRVEIVTKCGIVAPAGRYADARVKHYNTSKEHILQSVDTSLRLMNIDVIDLLLIHRPDPFMDHRNAAEGLEAVIASGKVKSVGVSNFKPHDWQLLESAMSSPLVTNQIEMSVMATEAFTNGDLSFLQQRDVPAMAWSPLGGGGLFTGTNAQLTATLKSVSERFDTDISNVALAWLMSHPSAIIPVLGTNKIERIGNVEAALSLRLDRETWFEIYTAAIGRDVP
ncbi:MAG: aldo/keto reductase [Pseudomonadota bacterium]